MPPKSSPRRAKSRATGSDNSGTMTGGETDEGFVPDTTSRSTSVVFEILPSLSPFEPTPSESLLRMQQKADRQELNLYDMSAGKGASVGKIEKTYEMEIREELASYSTKKEAPVPLWMRDINRQVFETTLDYTKTKSTYSKADIYGLNGQPKTTEREDVIVIQPTSLPEMPEHNHIEVPKSYQLYNNMSRNALIADRLEKFGKTFDTTRYDVQREIRFRTMEQKREDFRRNDYRPDFAIDKTTAKGMAKSYLAAQEDAAAKAREKEVLTTVPFTQAYLDGLVELKDTVKVGAADR